MEKYVLNTVVTYRVPTVNDVLALRSELHDNGLGELASFSYTTKYDKKTDEEYQIVKAKIVFTTEKELSQMVDVEYAEVG